MTRQEKINIVLDARPRMVHIIKCANDDQLDRLVEEVNKDLQRELDEASFAWFYLNYRDKAFVLKLALIRKEGATTC